MADKDIAFALNHTNLYMINTTPGAASKSWAWIAPGIQTVTPSSNETTDQTAYYDGGGQASTDVTGAQNTWAFSGHRKYGDPAQEYVVGLQFTYGEARKTDFRLVQPDGSTIESRVTVANIVNGGGDANSKGTFSFELHSDGVPTATPGDMASLPTSITAQPVSVNVGETAQLAVTAEPEGASKVCTYGVEDDAIATVDATGLVAGVKQGTTHVRVKSALKPSLSIDVEVTVKEGV